MDIAQAMDINPPRQITL
jgi:stalled ribosome rescue protein Dom34